MKPKFHVGQLVILARPRKTPHMKGAIGEVVALPGVLNGVLPNGKKWKRSKFPEYYVVHYPGYSGGENHEYWNSAGHMLDPLRDDDNFTKEEEDKLVFNPGRIKEDHKHE